MIALAVEGALTVESEVQRVILLACLERQGYVALAELTKKVEGLVKYRASAALSQNAMLLERRGVIERVTEGRRVYVKIRPIYVQRARDALSYRAPIGLISGYTWNPDRPSDLTPLRNYVDAIEKLRGDGVEVSYVVCFTTPEAKEARDKLSVKPNPDEEVLLPFKVYQSEYEKLKEAVVQVVDRLIYKYDLILDVTPLTKLFTDILAEVSERYGLKRIYHFGPLTWIRK